MKKLITIYYVGIWMLLIGSVPAADRSKPNPDGSARAGKSVSDFLTLDGQIDINAVRRSGYQGPLDLKGVDVRVDPRSGAPMVSASSPQSPADDPDDQYWDNSISPSIPGVNGAVYAMTVYDEKLIIGGYFTVVYGVSANNIASWNGNDWSPLGSGINGSVSALTVYNGRLIAGGSFTTAGSVVANNVAAWNGFSWDPLAAGTNKYRWGVFALSVYDGKLIAGGDFTIAGSDSAFRIAAWDGARWSPLGSGLTGAWDNFTCVYALAVYEGELVAGGLFDTAGGVAANHIASWDGSDWLALGSGLSETGTVLSLIIFDGKLIAGGLYTLVGSDSSSLVAAWNGISWSSLMTGHGSRGWYDYVASLTVVADKLVAGHNSVGTLGGRSASIDVWDRSNWSSILSGVGEGQPPQSPGISRPGLIDGYHSPVFNLTTYRGTLILGGDFLPMAGGVPDNSISSWDGSSWRSLASRSIGALIEYDEKLIAGGRFTTTNGANNIAYWDGNTWSPMTSRWWPSDYFVRALNVYDGKLIQGGYIWWPAGGVYNIVSWDGSSWSALGSGTDYWIDALTIYDGKLIAGGIFSTAGRAPASKIASWNGSTWSPLGLGMEGQYAEVISLTEYNGMLIAGGVFSTAGGDSANNIAAWNGINWSPLGSGIRGGYWDGPHVYALTVFNGKLIAGGYFTTAGGVEAVSVASWDGSNWSPMGSGMGGGERGPTIFALNIYEGKLIAGGNFTSADGVTSNYISSWDGTNWSPLGSGLNRQVGALTIFDGKLIAGGNFTIAGNKPAAYLAAWTKRSTRAVSLDIKPGSCPNPLNGTDQSRGKAVLPAAIVGTADFDVHDIDPTSITLNGVSPIRWGYEDVSALVDKSNDSCACADSGPDRIADLTLKFDRNAIEATIVNPPTRKGVPSAAGDVTSEEKADAVLVSENQTCPMSRDRRILVIRGNLNDGSAFEGYDCVLFMSKNGATAIRVDELPRELRLSANHPNPFNSSTTIEYSLPTQMQVTIEIFNLLGQKVRTLVDEARPAGRHQIEWNGIDNNGLPVSTGVYLYRIQAGDFVETKKMVLLK